MQSNPWDPPSNSDSSDGDLMIVEAVPSPTKEDRNAKTAKDRTVPQQKKQPMTKRDSNSEEDDVVILDADSILCKSA